MSEQPIIISYLNDFIFCPASIYFHGIDSGAEELTYQDSYQINGKAAHRAVDSGNYSDRKDILQGIDVYCEKYDLYGKIDVFDVSKGLLIERKRQISKIYDGYIFQVYAQYFALTEMGYKVNSIRLYSMDDNKNYPLKLPDESPVFFANFENLISEIKNFSLDSFTGVSQEKCKKCIYSPMCSFAKREE